MKNKWEIRGLTYEVVGLLFILISGAWQVFFNDWFDKQSVDSFYQQNQYADMAILAAIRDSSYALANENPEVRVIHLNKVSEQIGRATLGLSDDAKRRRMLEKNQAETFKTIRFAIFALGSFLVLFGKSCVCYHKARSAAAPSMSRVHPVLLFRQKKSERVSDKPIS